MAATLRRPADYARLAKVAFAYARYSDQKQGSIAEQNAINDEVAGEHGLTIDRRFSDEETSRSRSDRVGLMAMFAALKERPEVGFIVVNELERMTAGVGQRATITALCQEHRVTIVTEDLGPIDPFDERAMQTADERAVSANAEVLKIRRRTRRNMRQKNLAGTVMMRPAFGTRMKPLTGPDGMPLPSGARLVDDNGRVVRSGELEVHPEELPWLQKMFEWAAADVSSDAIARRLTAAGVQTKSGNDLWRANTVAGILSNPFYKGEMIWGRQATVRPINGRKRLETRSEDDPAVVRQASPLGALVDPAVWERVNAMREQRRAQREHNKSARERHLFDGMVFCGRCGHKMYGRPEGYTPKDGSPRRITGYRYYCYSMRPGWAQLPGFGPVCSSANSITEKKIIEVIGKIQLDDLPSIPVRLEPSPGREGERRTLEARVADARARLNRAEDLALDGLISPEKLSAVKTTCEGVLGAAREELTQLAVGAYAAAASGARLLEAADSLSVLATLLQSDDLSTDDKVDALRGVRLRRFYVDGPRVQVGVEL